MDTETTRLNLPQIDGYSFRMGRREDVPAIMEMIEAIEAYEYRGWYTDVDDLYRDFDDPYVNPAKNLLLAVDSQGKVAGLGGVDEPLPDNHREHRSSLWGEVHPEHRGRGLGNALFSWMERRAEEILLPIPGDLPRVMRVGVNTTLKDRIALYEKHGFTPGRYFYRMIRDLSAPIPEPRLPVGLTLTRWSPELDEQTCHVFNESFQDHWGFEPFPFDLWQHWFSKHPEFLADCSFLALDGENAVAMCICMERSAENRKTGTNDAWIQDVGTLRPYRKIGLATALMCAAMHAMKQKGYSRVGLAVDTESPTGALGIYERLGFSPLLKNVVYEKYLGAKGIDKP